MSQRDRVRLFIEMALAGLILAAGSLCVRLAHGQTTPGENGPGFYNYHCPKCGYGFDSLYHGTEEAETVAATDPGYTVNDPTKASENTAWLQKQLDKGGTTQLPVGRLYINKRVYTPFKIGSARITSKGAGIGYWYPSDHPSKLSDGQSRILQLTPGEPIFVFRGAGVISYSPVVLEGQAAAAAVEVEGGNNQIATGHHHIENWGFWRCKQAVKALGGYYKDGQFVADENHADNSTVEKCYFFDVDTLFRSENQQALNWRFRDCFWQGTAHADQGVAFDVPRGGSLTVDGLVVENARCTLLRIKDFSPNNNRFDFRGVWFDTMLDPKPNFCFVEYVGDPVAAAWSNYGITIDGFAGTQQIPLERHVQYRGCERLPKSRWKINIDHVIQGK